MKTYIAGNLKKQGGGAPSSEAVRRFLEKVDADDDWFPGKANYDYVGAPSVMTGPQRAALARCNDNEKRRHRANLWQSHCSMSQGGA